MKKQLLEVNIIRPTVIILLVLLHSFAIFYGEWPNPIGVKEIKIYEYLSWFIRGFRIETIAFVAGYVFSYQTNDLNRKFTLFSIIKKKFFRLIIPCWFFGIVYVLCFSRNEPITNNVISILNGAGHLWFLTMLFWCFIGLYIIDKYSKGRCNFLLFFVLSAISCIPIPQIIPLFGINKMPHFLLYTYLGYLFYIHKNQIFNKLQNKQILLLLTYSILVILSFYLFPMLRQLESLSTLTTIIIYLSLKISQYLTAVIGITFIYILVMKFLKKRGPDYKLPEIINKANKECYGIYIFHQFILIFIYYNTNLPRLVNSYVLPILSFIIVLLSSALLTDLFTRSKVGQFLIG